MHSKNIVHRDINSKNVFLNKFNDVKIGDFSVSLILNENPKAMEQAGT